MHQARAHMCRQSQTHLRHLRLRNQRTSGPTDPILCLAGQFRPASDGLVAVVSVVGHVALGHVKALQA